MLARFSRIMSGLVVYEKNMARNMDVFGGVVFSQAVMLKLIEKGLSREDSYKLVQTNAMKAWNTDNGSFKDHLMNDPSVTKHLRKEEIASCFDPHEYLKNIDVVFDRLGV